MRSFAARTALSTFNDYANLSKLRTSKLTDGQLSLPHEMSEKLRIYE